MKMKWILALALFCGAAVAADKEDKPLGLILNEPGAFVGYNLFTPLDTGSTYLIDNEGHVIHTWESDYRGGAVYLLENGNILRMAGYGLQGNGVFFGGGASYRVEEFSWDGERLWEFVYASDEHLMHHDVQRLPNGNVLILAWEMKSREEAFAAGRDPDLLTGDELWPEHVIEVRPIRPNGAEVVWEWHLWDHLIQDFDESMDNYGDVAAHPERIDINPTGHWMDRISAEEAEELEALGYLGGDEPAEEDSKKTKRRGSKAADWNHTNAIAYNAELDQIVLSVLANNELWIIDHGTTTQEARGSTGGRYGKGGDLLYRWGNPTAYHAGNEYDQRLFSQHDVHWIPEGRPGAGHIILFNNGRGRSDGVYSSITEIATPIDSNGAYRWEQGKPYEPHAAVWEYTAPTKKDFYSSFISGTQRQPNGNTLTCLGASGTFVEITADGKVVWRYVYPAASSRPPEPKKKKKKKKATVDRKKNRSPRLNNAVYRVYRYAPDYPAFNGRDLSPGPLLSDYLKKNPAKTPLDLEE